MWETSDRPRERQTSASSTSTDFSSTPIVAYKSALQATLRDAAPRSTSSSSLASSAVTSTGPTAVAVGDEAEEPVDQSAPAKAAPEEAAAVDEAEVARLSAFLVVPDDMRDAKSLRQLGEQFCHLQVDKSVGFQLRSSSCLLSEA